MKKIALCLVAAVMSAALFAIIGCNNEDEYYYENGQYTLASHRKTRCFEGGGGGRRQEMEIQESISANFKFKYLYKVDSTMTSTVGGTVVFTLDTAGHVKDRPVFHWDTNFDVNIVSEDVTYENNKLVISAKAHYTKNHDFREASWSETYNRSY